MTAQIQLIEALKSARDVDTLAQALRDPDRLVRQAAAEALGQIGEERAIEPLVGALQDTHWLVRKAAIAALGMIGDARAIEPLLATLRADLLVREPVGEALARIGVPAVEPLHVAMQDQNRGVRIAAAEVLGQIGDARAVEPLLAALRNDAWSRVREAAAEALGQIGDARAVEPLLVALRDSHTCVGVAAAAALGQMGDARGVEALIALLLNADWLTRTTAAAALGRIGDSEAMEALVVALQDRDWRVRKAAVGALGEIGDARAIEPLLATLRADAPDPESVNEAMAKIGVSAIEPLAAALRNDNRWIRDAAAEALTRIGSPAIEPLLAALRDPNWLARQAAAAALGGIGDARAMEPLTSALRDAEQNVRVTAAVALGRIGDAHAIEPLLVALRDANRDIRVAAAAALGRIGDAHAIEPLLVALRDADRDVRVAAAAALGRIGDAYAIEPLISALRDADRDVREAAAEALGEIAIEPLFVALRDDNRRTRDAAAGALAKIAVEPLLAALRDADQNVRAAAAGALLEMPGEANAGIRQAAAEALEEIRRDESEATALAPSAPAEYADESVHSPPTRVQLSAFFPNEMRPGAWYTLLAYVHLQGALAAVQADSKKRLEPEISTGRTSRIAGVEIARGAEISAVPELPGCHINPAHVRFRWLEDWHRTEFRLQAAANVAGFTTDTAVTGRVALYVEGLLVGELPIWTYISEEAAVADADIVVQSRSASIFQAIFASYSHEDADVVDTLSRAYEALGNTFLRDVETLRSGEIWDQRLLYLIEKADIFQLYWSEAAKRSPNVEKEWRHALAQARSTFIRPVYWRQPLPEPPAELARFHFAYCALRAPGPGEAKLDAS